MADPGPAAAEFRPQVEEADTVVIASPEYAGGTAGGLKNALDWLVGSGELDDCAAGVISSGTTGGEHARRGVDPGHVR